MSVLLMIAFGEEILEGKMIRMKSACLAHLSLKFIDFISGIWMFRQLGSCLKSNSLEYKISWFIARHSDENYVLDCSKTG